MNLLRADPGSASFLARHPLASLLAAAAASIAITTALHIFNLDDRALSQGPAVAEVLDDPGSPHAGAARPDVTVVVFADYQCPICKATDPALEHLLETDPGVRIIYKDWPIFGPASQAAARVALAVHRQGRYAAFHKILMASRGKLDDAEVQHAAVAAGADWRQVTDDLNLRRTEFDAQLSRHGVQALSLGLQGTPGYLVGPYLISGGLNSAQLATAVRRARRARN